MDKTVRNAEVELATETFGDPASSPLLLIMGVMASKLWWPDDFCRMLAATGRFVIRYDNRDTGLSTTYEPGEAPYTMEDMANDAVAVLDGHGVGRASLVGMSLGGMIAQIAAFRHPQRVSTLTLISTTPVGVDASTLPGMSEAYLAHAAEGEHVDWTDNAQVIEHVVKDMRMIAGTAHAHDEASARALVERDVARARNFASATNHFTLRSDGYWRDGLSRLRAPLLVLHGTADPIYPVEHGRRIADTVAGSRFVAMEGGGHELHPQDWPRMVEEIAAHSAGVR